MSRLAVEIVTVKPNTTSISEATVAIKNVVLPKRGTTRNSIRKTTNTNSDSAWSIMEIFDVRVALKVSIYRKKMLANMKASLTVRMILRPEGSKNSNKMTLIND